MKKWERLYDQALAISRESKGSVYDLVKKLAEVYEDSQFKEDMERRGMPPGVFLNNAVDHTLANFSELYAMIKAFPRREQWCGDLRAMRSSLSANIKERRVAGRRENRERILSWKQKFIDLEAKYKILEAKYQQLEKDYAAIQKSRSRRAS